MQLPSFVVKYGTKAGTWLVKNGPKIASVAGAGMTIAGAVMACEATLRADSILDNHKAQMARIAEAKDISEKALASGDDVLPEMVYTDRQMKEDKTRVYLNTAVSLVKLYAPAVAVGFAGIGLMEGAFIVTERRRASAIAALTAAEQAYNDILARSLPEGEDLVHPIETETRTINDAEQVVLDPDKIADPFFFVFDNRNPNWYGNTGYLLNTRFITGTIDAMNLQLSAHSYTHFWVEDLLDRLDIEPETKEQKELCHFHGWNAAAGDIIDYDLIPYIVVRESDTDSDPLYVPTTLDELKEIELSDDPIEYVIGLRLKSSSEGCDRSIQPRMIYREVCGG